MAASDRFNILIIDPDSQSRGNLKQAALALPSFKKVYVCSFLREGIDKADGTEPIDVVFVSYRFPQEEVEEFVAEAKKLSRGKDWAYVAVLKAKEQKNDVIANSVIGGLNGFLFEPFSADNLREIAEITAKVKLEAESRRRQAAILVLLKEVSGHLDAVAFYKKRGTETPIANRKLAESSQNLKKFKGEMFGDYVETLIDYFSTIQPPPSLNYNGVSERVRKRMEEKMLKELEAQYEK